MGISLMKPASEQIKPICGIKHYLKNLGKGGEDDIL